MKKKDCAAAGGRGGSGGLIAPNAGCGLPIQGGGAAFSPCLYIAKRGNLAYKSTGYVCGWRVAAALSC